MTLQFEPQTVAAIATLCLGDPNKSLSKGNEIRFGANGSMTVALDMATFYDFEDKIGGGMLDFVARTKGYRGPEAIEWLRGNGIEIVDDQPEPDKPKGKPFFVQTFDYVDQDGKRLFQTRRFHFRLPDGSIELRDNGKPRKVFFQRRPDPDRAGEWINNLDGVRRVPYRLPELMQAIADHRAIFITEGERKVDLLRDWNQAATCNAGGAKKWLPEHSALFVGATVIILPDNDDTGRGHLDIVAASLIKAGAANVRVLDLPGLGTKQDVIDWAAAGGTAEMLLDLVEHSARPWTPGNARRDAVGFDGFEGAPREHIEKNLWPDPTPIKSSLPAVQPFTPELLPNALRDYVLDVADRQQAPPDFAAVAAMCGLASLAGNNVRVRPKQHDDWMVVPNLWGAIIGRPSAMKSPAMRSALAPVYALQDSLCKEWEVAQNEAAIETTLSELAAGEARKKAAKAIKGDDREEAKRLLAEHKHDDEDEARCPRLIVNDATVEKLGELMNENPHGLLLIRDELPGFLARMESEEFQSERAFYLEAFNGDGPFTYDRIGRGTVHIENCTLSIIGGVQPARIAPLVRGAMTGVSDDGLIQRLQLAVWPDDIGSWVWIDRSPDVSARDKYETAFRDLYAFARGMKEPAIFGFCSRAQDMFRQWMTEIQTEARCGKLPSMLESHLLKMPKTVASLALLFHLVDGGREEIGAEATGRALDWADYLRSHANRLYSSGCVMAENGARLITDRRAQLPQQFTARNIHQKAWAGLADRDAVAAAIELLVANGFCREIPAAPSPAGGRPSFTYSWNPRIEVEG